MRERTTSDEGKGCSLYDDCHLRKETLKKKKLPVREDQWVRAKENSDGRCNASPDSLLLKKSRQSTSRRQQKRGKMLSRETSITHRREGRLRGKPYVTRKRQAAYWQGASDRRTLKTQASTRRHKKSNLDAVAKGTAPDELQRGTKNSPDESLLHCLATAVEMEDCDEWGRERRHE